MIETIHFNGKAYPKLQSEGFAAKFAFPFAKELCKGAGLDIGYCKPEWKFPGALGIENGKICMEVGNEIADAEASAMSVPNTYGSKGWDYIFSSHCIEHVQNWVDALNYWHSMLKQGGVLFLYLPHWKQEYWRSWHNRKHIHIFLPEIIEAYLNDPHYGPVTDSKEYPGMKQMNRNRKWTNIFVSGADLNDSFYAIAEKR